MNEITKDLNSDFNDWANNDKAEDEEFCDNCHVPLDACICGTPLEDGGFAPTPDETFIRYAEPPF